MDDRRGKYIDAACSGTDFNILFATLMPSNESLTERNRMLFKDCLKAKKDMAFKFIWTLNGKIFMRKDKDSPVPLIKNKEDLQETQSR